ncbi:MAG: SRPBCC family protein [Acidimicrobiia bacterium]
MKPVQLVVLLNTPPTRVWAELADLASHPQWMGDAEAVEFLDSRTGGVGTRMRVPTRIGPLRATDVMTVVGWDDGRLIEVEHVGSVTGVGRFEIRPSGSGTELRWTETLRFPWWLGGVFGAWLAQPILRKVWKGNLERLRQRVEVSGP